MTGPLLAAARVAATTFVDYHPGCRFVGLVVDGFGEAGGSGSEPFEAWSLEDLALADGELRRVRGYVELMGVVDDVMALADVLVPRLLRAVLASGSETAVYVAPDTKVFGNVDDVVQLAGRHGVVLVPYVTEPARPGERARPSGAVYDTGFLAVSRGGQPFLDCWAQRPRLDTYLDAPTGRTVDQPWVNLVPGLFDCHVLRHPGYGVAYWNLEHRHVGWDGRSGTVDGSPLVTMRFSGFDPATPFLLTRDDGDQPRILLSERPELSQLCAAYASDLAATGAAITTGRSEDGRLLPNGVRLDRDLRLQYRSWVLERERLGEDPPPEPVSARGADDFVKFLLTPEAGSRMPRHLAEQWSRRPDLQSVYPHPEGKDFEPFLAWAEGEVRYGRMHPLLVHWTTSPGNAPSPSSSVAPNVQWAEPAAVQPGICVAGYLRAELGMGELGRLALATVRRSGIDHATFVFGGTASRQQHPLDEAPRPDLNVNVIAVNGDQIRSFASQVGPDFFRGRYNIGLWAWELEDFPPAFQEGLADLDEVWTISEFSRAAIARVTDKPVHTLPLPIVAPDLPDGFIRATLGLPDGFLFLFYFDLLSDIERKNPMGVVEAFKSAFAPQEGPMLLIKALNGDRRLVDLERLRYATAGRSDIVILDRYLDADANSALMAMSDCYVSLHRSEGFGLTLAEAMVLGKPVIGTAYSGNLDFMDASNSYLVPWTAIEVPPGCDPYPAGSKWAQPDLVAASEAMRRVVDHPAEAAQVAARGRATVLAQHGFDQSVAFVDVRFGAAQEMLRQRPAVASPAPAIASPPASSITRLKRRLAALPRRLKHAARRSS